MGGPTTPKTAAAVTNVTVKPAAAVGTGGGGGTPPPAAAGTPTGPFGFVAGPGFPAGSVSLINRNNTFVLEPNGNLVFTPPGPGVIPTSFPDTETGPFGFFGTLLDNVGQRMARRGQV